MRLRRLELVGFKSFADTTEFSFDDGVTAIIGPNGCGKSNISDAVRWVLGEHNPRVLRGTRMEEVIFQGCLSRPPHNVAEVALHFDNGDRLFDLDFAEVVISRRVSRTGQSEFFINQAPLTRRDLMAKLAGTGLGTDQSVVIEARMVDALLSERPDDRRALFEEAAGLGLYRERRRAAERRLEETGADLSRIEDLIAEVQSQVRSLARQRGKADRHRELTARRYAIAVTLARRDLTAVDAELARGRARRAELEDELPRARAALADAEGLRGATLEARAAAEARRAELARRLADARLDVGRLEGDLSLAAERSANAAQRRERALAERDEAEAASGRTAREREAALTQREASARRRDALRQELALRADEEETIRRRLAAQREQLHALETKLQKLAEALRSSRGERQALDRELTDLRQDLAAAAARSAALDRDAAAAAEAVRHQRARHEAAAARSAAVEREAEGARRTLADSREAEAALRSACRTAEDGLAQLAARRDALRQLERDRAGLAPAAAALLEARSRFPEGAILGPLSDFVLARGEDATLADRALGEWLHAVVVADLSTSDAIALWHAERAPGPLLLLPLDPGPTGPAGPGPTLALAPNRRGSGLASRIACLEPADGWARSLLAGCRALEATSGAILRANGAVFLSGREDAGGPIRRRADREALDDEAARLELEVAGLESRADVAAQTTLRSEAEAADAESAVEAARNEEREARLAVDDAERHLTQLARELASERALAERLGERRRAAEERLAAVDRELAEGDLARVREEERLGAEQTRLRELEATREAARELRVRSQVEDAELAAEERAAAEREQRAADTLGQLAARAESLGTEIGSLDSELATLSGQRVRWADELGERRAALAELESAAAAAERAVAGAERDLAQAEAALTAERDRLAALADERHRLDLEASELGGGRRALGERLSAEWGKPLEELLAEEAAAEGETEELRHEAERLREAILNMGPINALAAEEHAEATRRLGFLQEQHHDLVAARATLQQSVRELDAVAFQRFTTTFGAAREHFRNVFTTLFGGGECDVRLAAEHDPLESEIEITARPPGKRTERLHALSQGERSLVALSLLFGIYLTKPSPFCVLDEVDAPLDDANISRFTRLLEEFKAATQFIVITHNPRTMQAADAVYGVTMQEAGVSSAVSVRLGALTRA